MIAPFFGRNTFSVCHQCHLDLGSTNPANSQPKLNWSRTFEIRWLIALTPLFQTYILVRRPHISYLFPLSCQKLVHRRSTLLYVICIRYSRFHKKDRRLVLHSLHSFGSLFWAVDLFRIKIEFLNYLLFNKK